MTCPKHGVPFLWAQGHHVSQGLCERTFQVDRAGPAGRGTHCADPEELGALGESQQFWVIGPVRW